MINLKVKRLTDTAKLPTYAHDGDACFDLYADDVNETHGGHARCAGGYTARAWRLGRLPATARNRLHKGSHAAGAARWVLVGG